MYPNPKARPHLARTWILLALIGALAIAGLLTISYLFGPVKAKLPEQVYGPAPSWMPTETPTVPEPTWLFETPAVNR